VGARTIRDPGGRMGPGLSVIGNQARHVGRAMGVRFGVDGLRA